MNIDHERVDGTCLSQGTYFGEEEMRQRAPLLHHFYVGQYDEETRRVPNPPRNLAESLLYLQDEAEVRDWPRDWLLWVELSLHLMCLLLWVREKTAFSTLFACRFVCKFVCNF